MSDDEKSGREHLRELAVSDRPTAPVYAEMFRRRHGIDPETGESVDDSGGGS